MMRMMLISILLGLGNGFSPMISSMGKIIKGRLDNGNNNEVYEMEGVDKKETACVLFFTGLNSVIPGEVYDKFLSNLALKGVSSYVADSDLDITADLLDDLVESYANVTVVGHSSGSVNAIGLCSNNKDVKRLVLMDPVDNSFLLDRYRNKDLVLKYVEKVLFLNAAKSYEWNFSPKDFTVPFIPAFDIKPDDIKLKKGVSETIEASEFGHSDILDKTWSDFMHGTISKGSDIRDEEVLNEYKRWLSITIKNFITGEEFVEVVKSPEEHVDDAVKEINKFYKEVSDKVKINTAKIINSSKKRKLNNTSIVYKKI